MHTHRGQALSFYEDRSTHGRPLVLLHSVNACASSYEMKPLFEKFRATRPVYALDLPGFGFSDRDARPYTPDLYTQELTDFLARVKDKGDAPDVVALSLTCEFVARVASARKDLVHSLAFISPTGLAKEKHHADIGGPSPMPFWGTLAFGVIASRPSIRYFLGKSFVGPVDDGLKEYAYQTSHQRGGARAPIAFLTGKLFTPDIEDTYARLERPVMVLYDCDGYTNFERLDALVARSPMWTATRISPSLGMPQFERTTETVDALEAFWRTTSHSRHNS